MVRNILFDLNYNLNFFVNFWALWVKLFLTFRPPYWTCFLQITQVPWSSTNILNSCSLFLFYYLLKTVGIARSFVLLLEKCLDKFDLLANRYLASIGRDKCSLSGQPVHLVNLFLWHGVERCSYKKWRLFPLYSLTNVHVSILAVFLSVINSMSEISMIYLITAHVYLLNVDRQPNRYYIKNFIEIKFILRNFHF